MTTQLYRQTLLILGAAVLASAPVASQAKDSSGMDVCINAFVNEQLPKGHPIKIVKQDSANRWNLPQSSKIEVSAKGRQTGGDYGSAVCVVNRKGELVAMEIRGERPRYADRGLIEKEPRG